MSEQEFGGKITVLKYILSTQRRKSDAANKPLLKDEGSNTRKQCSPCCRGTKLATPELLLPPPLLEGIDRHARVKRGPVRLLSKLEHEFDNCGADSLGQTSCNALNMTMTGTPQESSRPVWPAHWKLSWETCHRRKHHCRHSKLASFLALWALVACFQAFTVHGIKAILLKSQCVTSLLQLWLRVIWVFCHSRHTKRTSCIGELVDIEEQIKFTVNGFLVFCWGSREHTASFKGQRLWHGLATSGKTNVQTEHEVEQSCHLNTQSSECCWDLVSWRSRDCATLKRHLKSQGSVLLPWVGLL